MGLIGLAVVLAVGLTLMPLSPTILVRADKLIQ